MKCPFCGFLNDKVVDSRESKEGESIRRRRECMKCERRFTTYERIDEIPYMVVKKDGRREKFDRQRYLVNQAIWHGELEDVRRETGRMVNAWLALDRVAAVPRRRRASLAPRRRGRAAGRQPG